MKKAIFYMKQGIDILVTLPTERRGLGLRYGQLGKLYCDQGDIISCISLIKDALKINREFNDSRNEVKNLIQLGLSYNKLHNYEESIKYLSLAIELSEKYEFLELEKEANHELGFIHSEILENYDKAYIYFSRASELLGKILGNLIKESIEFKFISPAQDLVLMYQGLLEKYHIESIRNYKENTEILKRAFNRFVDQ
ncbi:MAG: tetratricopeptide repeat protein [Candidatus Hodarchaeota archaeon]